jgi:hypothetical protein
MPQQCRQIDPQQEQADIVSLRKCSRAWRSFRCKAQQTRATITTPHFETIPWWMCYTMGKQTETGQCQVDCQCSREEIITPDTAASLMKVETRTRSMGFFSKSFIRIKGIVEKDHWCRPKATVDAPLTRRST